jgi:hypothetical protein
MVDLRGLELARWNTTEKVFPKVLPFVQCGRALRKDSVLVFDTGQPLRKLSELLFEKKLLIPALRQLVSSHPKQHDG